MTADPMIHCGRGICAAEEGHAGTCDEASGWAEEESDVRPVSPARDAVSDAEAAQWAALADAATEGPWVVDSDGSIGAPMAGLVCGEAGHPRLDCSECGTRVCHINVMPGEPDAAFIAAARTAVPRLLDEREALRAEVERMRGQAKVEDVFYLDMCRERDHERAMRAERTAERDRARGTAVALEAENARLREGIERLASDLYNPLHERDGAAPQDMPEVAEDLRALLADTDSAREDDGGTMTPEQRVYRAMADAALHPIPPGLAWYAVEAVRAALTSDDPEVVRAMAERVGLHSYRQRNVSGVWQSFGTPWREVPDAD